MSENSGPGMDPGPVPDSLDQNDNENEVAEISEDVPAAPFPYVDSEASQDDGSDFDAELG
jgi:hypothetical protein